MKSLLLLSFIFLWSLSLRGQPSRFVMLEESHLNKIESTIDGGLLLLPQQDILSSECDPPYTSSFFKTTPEGETQWGAVYKGSRIHSFTQDRQGNIYLSGAQDISYVRPNLFLAMLTPQGNPLWSLELPVEGVFRDGIITAAGNMVTCGSIRTTTDFLDFLAAFNPHGDMIWAKSIVPGSQELGIWDHHIASSGRTMLLATTASYEGCCLDQPFSLVTFSEDGLLSSANLFYEKQSMEDPNLYSVIEVNGIVSDTARSILYGTLALRTPTPENDPDSMPMDFTTEDFCFLIALDNEQNILWSRRIGLEHFGWNALLQEDGSVILASADSPATILQFNSTGDLIRSFNLFRRSTLADIPDDAIIDLGEPTNGILLSTITSTGTDRVAAGCWIDVPSSQGQSVRTALLDFDLALPPSCLITTPLKAEVSSLEFVREPFPLEFRDIDNLDAFPVVLKVEANRIETTDLCADFPPAENGKAEE